MFTVSTVIMNADDDVKALADRLADKGINLLEVSVGEKTLFGFEIEVTLESESAAALSEVLMNETVSYA